MAVNWQVIDRLNYGQVLMSGLVVLTLVYLPLAAWYGTQPTRSRSEAVEVKPVPTFEPERIKPAGQVQILGLVPFSGKAGDEVVMWGNNFGTNPADGQIFIGDTKVSQIRQWQDDEIIFTIPPGAGSDLVRIEAGGYIGRWDKPLTIYNQMTNVRVNYQNQKLTVNSLGEAATVRVWHGTGSAFLEWPAPAGLKTTLPETIEELTWITLTSAAGNLIPFWVGQSD